MAYREKVYLRSKFIYLLQRKNIFENTKKNKKNPPPLLRPNMKNCHAPVTWKADNEHVRPGAMHICQSYSLYPVTNTNFLPVPDLAIGSIGWNLAPQNLGVSDQGVCYF